MVIHGTKIAYKINEFSESMGWRKSSEREHDGTLKNAKG
jgi:hypothetical protein